MTILLQHFKCHELMQLVNTIANKTPEHAIFVLISDMNIVRNYVGETACFRLIYNYTEERIGT